MSTDDIKINFPDCYPGKEYVRLVDWTFVQKILKIERDEKTNRCEWMFHVTEEPPPAKALRINYKPILPNTSNFDYFYVTIESRDCIKIILSGTTLAPSVRCKTNNIILHCTNADPVKRLLHLVNRGTMETIFQFDIDNKNSDVTISPCGGTIRKDETIDLLLTYYPKRPAIVFRQIFCLVHYQEPFSITVRANYNKSSAYNEFDDLINIQEPLPTYPNSYEAYLQDVATKLFQQSKPLFTLDRKYIDFGMIDPIKGLRSSTESFSITNHLMVKIFITWVFDDSINFSVQPRNAEVGNGCSLLFRAKFDPCFPDQLYTATITARIQWGTDYDFVVPFPLSIDLIGHTFTGMRTGWDPFYQVSNSIILPATVPNAPSYGTYKLENTSQFPLMFKFNAPIATNVTLKPLHGIIEGGSFQIFNLRLFPGVKTDTYYNEKWILEINMFQKLEIEISTTAELPYLIFSNNEVIKFPPSNLHSESKKSVPVKNETRLTMKFKLIISDPDSPFFSEDEHHVIGPNELTQISLYYRPHRYGKLTSHIYFKMECKNPSSPHTYSSTIAKVMGVCSKVSIMAMPKYLYLTETLMNCWSYKTIAVKNNSNCEAYVVTDSKPRYNDENVLTEIEPKSFVIPARSKIHVRIGACPSTVGYKDMKIVYTLCSDHRLQTNINEAPETLLTFDIYCSAPRLQVIDIRLSRNHQDLAKYFMWKKLQINKLNEALEQLKFRPDDEEITVHMKLPVGALNSSAVGVDLLIKNVSSHKSRLDIQFIKKCSCKPVMEDVSMSFRKVITKCRHEEQITFTFEKQIFEPKQIRVVNLKCIYTETDKKKFQFRLSVTAMEDPKISGTTTLLFERVCCKPGMTFLDFNNPTSLTTTVMIDVYPVFVGDPCKPLQAIWAYNNFCEEIGYVIIPSVSDELQIFEFTNAYGVISAYSAHPIIYRFNPYQFRTYTRVFRLVTSHATFKLHMTGEGTITPCYETYNMLNKVPPYSLFSDKKEDVEVSMDNCRLEPMLLHTTKKKMIFIKNNTDENVEFSWTRRRFGAMFNIRVTPQQGVLKPSELAPCQIIIQSLSIPSRITIILTCVFIFLDRMKAYVSRVEHFRKIGRMFDSTFQHTTGSDYVPIKLNVKRGTKTRATFFNLTICAHSLSEKNLDYVLPNVKDQMKALSPNTIQFDRIAVSPLTKIEGDTCINTLTKVMWEVLNRKVFYMGVEKGREPTYYKDIVEAERILPVVDPPNRLIINILDTAIFKGLSKMFPIKKNWKADLCSTQRYDENEKQSVVHLSNKYYEDILENCTYPIVRLNNEGSVTLGKRDSDVRNKGKHIQFLRTTNFTKDN